MGASSVAKATPSPSKGKSMGNGRLRLMVEIMIVVFQTIIMVFGFEIRNSIGDHDRRIDELEQFASKGDRWTVPMEMQSQKEIAMRIEGVWSEVRRLEREKQNRSETPPPLFKAQVDRLAEWQRQHDKEHRKGK